MLAFCQDEVATEGTVWGINIRVQNKHFEANLELQVCPSGHTRSSFSASKFRFVSQDAVTVGQSVIINITLTGIYFTSYNYFAWFISESGALCLHGRWL